MTGPSHCFKEAFNFGHEGAIALLQADFSPSAIAGQTHRFRQAFNVSHDGAIAPLQVGFQLHS
jgi:hypothetical protein